MNLKERKLLEMDEELEKIEKLLTILAEKCGYDVKEAVGYIIACVIPQFRGQLNAAFLKELEEKE